MDKIRVSWEGMCWDTVQAVEVGGGRTDTYPFWYPQYLELTEWRVGVSVEGYREIKCGCGGLPGDKTDRSHLHEEIGRIKGCHYAGAKPAP